MDQLFACRPLTPSLIRGIYVFVVTSENGGYIDPVGSNEGGGCRFGSESGGIRRFGNPGTFSI